MNRCLAWTVALSFLPLQATAQPASPHGADPLSSACFFDLASALSTDEMEGRGVGTAGLERAADMIEARMRAIGLEGGAGDYRQDLEVITGVGRGEDNALQWNGGELGVGADFVPLGFSSSGPFAGRLLFAGYGIRADELGYDDYGAVEVEGRVVLALRFEPGEDDEHSPFNGRLPTRWSNLRYKATVARELGAAALVLVNVAPAGSDPRQLERLPGLRPEGPISRAGLPVIQVTYEVAEAWLATAGIDLVARRDAIDSEYRPQSVALDGVEIRGNVDVVPTRAAVRNVVGVWPGSGRLADEVVVVGAHYDHLGRGGEGSLAPGSTEVHNGADDNASGVAAMLCGVEHALRNCCGEGEDRRTLLVAAFTAEEIGLGGSSYYVENPLRPLEQTVAMVNLDMVGRVRDRQLSVLGAGSADEWGEILQPGAEEVGLRLELGGDGYGPSDQMAFYRAGIPVAHFFSGAHEQYHRPEDDADTLNAEGGAQVASLLSSTLEPLLTGPRLTYREPTSEPTMGGDRRGRGAYLGTIPDYSTMSQETGGVLLADVRPGGPADRAGLRGGDRLIRLGEWEIQNLYDMTFALQDHEPGEAVAVTVIRDGEALQLLAVLGRRGEGAGPLDVIEAGVAVDHLLDEREVHLSQLRQLTSGGENAEGYFSPDGRRLVYQATPRGAECDQQYVLDLETGASARLSSGSGRTTCGYFAYPHGERFIYATTESASAACPAPPDMSAGYVWALYEYDLVWQMAIDAAPEPFLPHPGYDAEATVCPVDGRVVFTSTRSGDLDLFTVNADGSDLRQITHTLGYDGGAFFTSDCERLVWRASRPEGEAAEAYRSLLARGLVRPSSLELFAMRSDGTDVRQLTDNGAANFAPYPLPDGSGVIFASNMETGGREFDLWLVGYDGGPPERVTYTDQFDGFPVVSPDGRWLVFASNRGAEVEGETNLFIARWSNG